MEAEQIPPELKAILDRRAGRIHSDGGTVMQCLAEILTKHEEMIMGKWSLERPMPPGWRDAWMRVGGQVGSNLHLEDPPRDVSVNIGRVDTEDLAEEIARRWNEYRDFFSDSEWGK